MGPPRSPCCAHAVNGQTAAAPPSSVMNSRRSHSITSSARPSMVAGTVMPSAFAVLRLNTISNLLDACTGNSRRLGALEDAIDVAGRLAELVGASMPYDIKPPLAG